MTGLTAIVKVKIHIPNGHYKYAHYRLLNPETKEALTDEEIIKGTIIYLDKVLPNQCGSIQHISHKIVECKIKHSRKERLEQKTQRVVEARKKMDGRRKNGNGKKRGNRNGRPKRTIQHKN